MCPTEDIDRKSNIHLVEKIQDKADSTLLNEFETVWGNIWNNKNMIHFLLTTRAQRQNGYS